jgi:hypothetical protein
MSLRQPSRVAMEIVRFTMCALFQRSLRGGREQSSSSRVHCRLGSNGQLRELIRVASTRTAPSSNIMMPTIDQASQFGIRIENHLTAPTARKAIPRTAIVTPINAITTIRSALLTKRSALLVTPARTRPRTSWITLSRKVDLSRSGN